jgi:phenylacetate-CoA ligase
VTSIESFQRLVPILSKQDVFPLTRLKDLLVTQSFENIDTLISSSGLTAQSFSLGLINRHGTRSMVRATDRLLDQWFDVRRKTTFLINTCAMGVRIPTSLPCIDLSVRSDKALAIAQALQPYFQQFIVTSDVFFLKKLLEDGLAAGSSWAEWPVHFVIGGEWFPESYRQYLAHLLQVDNADGSLSPSILASMGAAELGFNLCYETHDTVRLRALICSDRRLCDSLFGCVDTVPLIGHYDPRRWFVELARTSDATRGSGALVFTNIDPRAAMPLIRYETGDYGYLLSHASLSRTLRDFNYHTYIPRSTLPLMAVAGRTSEMLSVAGKTVRMEFLRSLLYSDRALASQTTGQFQATEAGDAMNIQIQLQPHTKADDIAPLQKRYSKLINTFIPASVQAVPYFDFRHGMTVNYETKFCHIGRWT